MEEAVGKKFGDPADPLLVSVRSGAALSMPGMMNTILNLGLTDASVEGLAKKTGNPRFAYDGYRRVIDMFGSTAMGVEHEAFEHELAGLKKERGVKLDTELDADDLKELVRRYKAVYQKHVGEPFPQDPKDQLWKAIMAVFNSWMGNKAVEYRRIERITGLEGDGRQRAGDGLRQHRQRLRHRRRVHPRPEHGRERVLRRLPDQRPGRGRGGRHPHAGADQPAEGEMPKVYEQLLEIRQKLEKHYKEMQDIEFTVQDGTLYMLQTRTGKRTGTAAVRIAVEMVKERLIDETTAIKRVSPESLNHLLLPQLDPKAKRKAVARGIAASPGAACGKVVLSAEAAIEHHAQAPERPDPAGAQGDQPRGRRRHASGQGHSDGHRRQGEPCGRGRPRLGKAVRRRLRRHCRSTRRPVKFTISGTIVKAGDFLTIDGTTGDVMIGKVPTVDPTIPGDFATLMTWADKVRTLKIRTNADTPEDSARARSFGAEGIGLCRTEHMFFGDQRIVAMRKMILADDEAGREGRAGGARAVPEAGLHRHLRGDGRTAGDDPLARPAAARVPAQATITRPARPRSPGSSASRVEKGQAPGRTASRAEPDAGPSRLPASDQVSRDRRHAGPGDHRSGDRRPEARQDRAAGDHDSAGRRRRGAVVPQEADDRDRRGRDEEGRRQGRLSDRHDDRDCPRAALTADQIAEEAEFFSFGTNDLTQMTFGFSRDDIGSFMPTYVEAKDPAGRPVPDDRRQRRRPVDRDRRDQGPQVAPGEARRAPEGRDLRRARR